jgi:hypothetical protein
MLCADLAQRKPRPADFEQHFFERRDMSPGEIEGNVIFGKSRVRTTPSDDRCASDKSGSWRFPKE